MAATEQQHAVGHFVAHALEGGKARVRLLVGQISKALQRETFAYSAGGFNQIGGAIARAQSAQGVLRSGRHRLRAGDAI